jgi:UPF0716 protein FxsA
MGRLLLLIFVVVPAVELILLVEIGQRVGMIATLGLIVGTGVVGASLARQQGVSTFARLRQDLGEGRSPAVPIIDGVLILVAAAFLVTPGVLTDVVGFLLLIPMSRRLIRRNLKRRFERAIRTGSVGVTVGSQGVGGPAPWSPLKNITPRGPTEPER